MEILGLTRQEKDESLQYYIKRFNKEAILVKSIDAKMNKY